MDNDLMKFLLARPKLKAEIEEDVVLCSAPSGKLVQCTSLVFDKEGGFSCHYAVVVSGSDTEYGSSVACTEEDYIAGLGWRLDVEGQGFGWAPNRLFHVIKVLQDGSRQHLSDFNCGQNDGTETHIITISQAMFRKHLPVVLHEVTRFGPDAKSTGCEILVPHPLTSVMDELHAVLGREKAEAWKRCEIDEHDRHDVELLIEALKTALRWYDGRYIPMTEEEAAVWGDSVVR